MRKTLFFIIVVIATITLIGCVNHVHALDLNLINNVRQNEIISAENLSIEANTTASTTATTNVTTSTTTASTYEDDPFGSFEDDPYTTYSDPYSDTYQESTTTATQATTTVGSEYSTTSNELTIGNILSILLIVIGFLLILLGIAIMIRMITDICVS